MELRELKFCKACNNEKPLDKFYRHKSTADKLYPTCKECTLDEFKRKRDSNPLDAKNKMFRDRARRYGITTKKLEELISLWPRCAICGNYETQKSYGNVRSLAVDHDRSCCPGKKSCGKCVRALLCGECNVKVGYLELDRDRLIGLMNYLDKFNSSSFVSEIYRFWKVNNDST